MQPEREAREKYWPQGKPVWIRDLEKQYGPVFRPLTTLAWGTNLEEIFERVNRHIQQFFGQYMKPRDMNFYMQLTAQHQFVGYSLNHQMADSEHLDDGVAAVKLSVWIPNKPGSDPAFGTVILFNEDALQERFYYYRYDEYGYRKYISETLYHEALHILFAASGKSDKRIHQRIEHFAKILARRQKVRPRAIRSFLEGRSNKRFAGKLV